MDRTEAPDKGGRPAYPPGMARNKTVHVRLTEREHRRYKQLARRDGVTLSEWIRLRLSQLAMPFGPDDA